MRSNPSHRLVASLSHALEGRAARDPGRPLDALDVDRQVALQLRALGDLT